MAKIAIRLPRPSLLLPAAAEEGDAGPDPQHPGDLARLSGLSRRPAEQAAMESRDCSAQVLGNQGVQTGASRAG